MSGSIAHGFQTPTSDIDVMIFITEENYRKRFQAGQLIFFNTDLSTYEGGYVDGKYISPEFVKHVLEKRSDPARLAFEGAQVLFSRIEGFAEDIYGIAEYPIAEKTERIKRFHAQLEAWH